MITMRLGSSGGPGRTACSLTDQRLSERVGRFSSPSIIELFAASVPPKSGHHKVEPISDEMAAAIAKSVSAMRSVKVPAKRFRFSSSLAARSASGRKEEGCREDLGIGQREEGGCRDA